MDNSGFDFKTILLLKLQGGLKPKKKKKTDAGWFEGCKLACILFHL